MRDVGQYKKELEEAGLPVYVKQKFVFSPECKRDSLLSL